MAPLVFKGRCFEESFLRCRSWKLGCPLWSGNHSIHGKKLWILSSLLIVGHRAGSTSMVRLCPQPPTHFTVCVWFFAFNFAFYLFVCLCVFRFFPEEVVPYVVVDSVCLWEKVSSGCFYITILNPL